MAILEVAVHWIDELARRRRGKTPKASRMLMCDTCANDGLFPPNQLHDTLYKVTETAYLCEVHAIVVKHRPPTPEFLRYVKR